MQIDLEPKLPINYESYNDPFRTLRPTVYKDGTAYCCISGPDPVEGIFGAGLTIEEAIEDWLRAYDKKNGGS